MDDGVVEGKVYSDAAPTASGTIDWAEVRRVYELGNEPVSAIRARFGLSAYRLASRRVAEGWTARPPVAKPLGLPKVAPAGIDELEFRLHRTIVIGQQMLNKRLAEEGVNEANARTAAELCRAMEILMRIARRKTGKTRETKNDDAGYDFRDDPAWLNAELDRRIERLYGPTRDVEDSPERDGRGEASVRREVGEVGKA